MIVYIMIKYAIRRNAVIVCSKIKYMRRKIIALISYCWLCVKQFPLVYIGSEMEKLFKSFIFIFYLHGADSQFPAVFIKGKKQ